MPHAIILVIMDHEEILKSGGNPSPGEQPPQAPEAGAVSPVARDLTLPPGASHVRVVLEVPESTCLSVEIEARGADGRLLGRQALVFEGGQAAAPAGGLQLLRPRWSIARLAAWARARADALPVWLFWLALSVYTLTRLFALPSFPIYFFTDEAVQTVSAADLLSNHFRSSTGELLPTYFENGSQYNLSASVYLQIIPYFFLGKSIWVTRGAAALMTLVAAASVGLILKRVFKNPYPWLAVMFLSITPAWFLHSRTAFETALATSFYAGFLYFYLLYRTDNSRYLYGAVILGALAFYSYSAMRLVIGITCLLLFLSDLKYHWQNRLILLSGLCLAGLLALPFVRFLVIHPDASSWQMRLLGSYWIMNMPLIQKLGNFASIYLHGLDPLYWYLPNTWDLSRHVLLGYGHILRQTLPLAFLGIGLAIGRIRLPAYRVLLIAILAAPSGGALVELGVTRVLTMVIPLAVLTALGAAFLMDWVQRRWKVSRALVSLSVFLFLAGINLYMLRDALVNGPLWYSDYSLSGQQYGAQQIFGEIARYIKEHPDTHIVLSPSWTNGADVVARFFFNDPLPFELGSIDGYFDEVKPLDDKTLFIMIPEEFASIPPTRFTDIKVEKTIPYPNGQPGFYFVRLKYVADINQVMAKEESQRRIPKTEVLSIGGQQVTINYSALDMGQISDLFDGNLDTLVRSYSINPMLLTFDFAQARAIKEVVLRVGGTATNVHLKIWQQGQDVPVEMTQAAPEEPEPHDMRLIFSAPENVTRLEISVQNTNDPPDGHVHLWEVTFQ